MAVQIVNELSKDLESGSVVHLKLCIHPLGDSIGCVTVEVLAGRHKVLLYASQCRVLPHIQVDDLVGDDGHALE